MMKCVLKKKKKRKKKESKRPRLVHSTNKFEAGDREKRLWNLGRKKEGGGSLVFGLQIYGNTERTEFVNRRQNLYDLSIPFSPSSSRICR
jgi:hypothetical protein